MYYVAYSHAVRFLDLNFYDTSILLFLIVS